MVSKGKVPVLILGVLILVSLSLAVMGYSLLQKERANNLALKDQLEDVVTKERISEAKLEESKKTISALEVKLQESQGRIESLTWDLEQEKTTRQESLTQIEELKADLEKQKTLGVDLENKFAQAKEEVKKTQSQLSELMNKKSELETKIKDLEAQVKKVELGTIVVESPAGAPGTAAKPAQTTTPTKKQEEPPAAKKLEGKVLVLNKEYNFVVINLGSKDGINIGDVFSIYHDNKILGDVTIGKVHDSMASADFDSLEIKNKVREGDKVVQKTK
jgi:DNA repair exonuclease SbcCD ATPase subunit